MVVAHGTIDVFLDGWAIAQLLIPGIVVAVLVNGVRLASHPALSVLLTGIPGDKCPFRTVLIEQLSQLEPPDRTLRRFVVRVGTLVPGFLRPCRPVARHNLIDTNGTF